MQLAKASRHGIVPTQVGNRHSAWLELWSTTPLRSTLVSDKRVAAATSRMYHCFLLLLLVWIRSVRFFRVNVDERGRILSMSRDGHGSVALIIHDFFESTSIHGAWRDGTVI